MVGLDGFSIIVLVFNFHPSIAVLLTKLSLFFLKKIIIWFLFDMDLLLLEVTNFLI